MYAWKRYSTYIWANGCGGGWCACALEVAGGSGCDWDAGAGTGAAGTAAVVAAVVSGATSLASISVRSIQPSSS